MSAPTTHTNADGVTIINHDTGHTVRRHTLDEYTTMMFTDKDSWVRYRNPETGTSSYVELDLPALIKALKLEGLV